MAAARVGELELIEMMDEGTDHHDDAAGLHRGLEVEILEGDLCRRLDLEIAADPFDGDSHRGQDFDDAIHLFDARHALESGSALV